ncbi:DNA-directed RNA polymerase subunit beta [Candidatus Bealeia paramacronuclearis]|uniref:DNA-directed RNA polymerase subunit beta n=1 Tax=Candidatus Bealeia paramacronuclearis TaxID=1921001 RepID=A0ABZ2C895_9PROT|nr:DNA-directed RNA polymerase subunit beta [Candidatus Bealeia paramacronuclearis]
MARTLTERKRIRKSFGRIPEVAPLPYLIELQKSSYANFIQMDVSPEERETKGLQEVFKSMFPITDFADKSQLEFYRYHVDPPKYDVEECKQRSLTYAAPLRVTFRLVVWDVDEETGSRSIRDIKEQDVYMGDLPLMTDNGTFVINGSERVVVSQMHRSPGVFFDHDSGKTHSSGKYLFSARVIPYRGSWIDFEFDAKDILYVRIDRKRKLPVSTLLMALDSAATQEKRIKLEKKGENLNPSEIQGMSREEILNDFYKMVEYNQTKKGWKTEFKPDHQRVGKLMRDIVDAKTGKTVAAEGAKMNLRFARKLYEDGLREILVPADDLLGQYIANDLINETTGEIFAEAGDEITPEILELFEGEGIKKIPVLDIDHMNVGSYLRNTLVIDKNNSREDALMDIYRVLRPGEPPTVEGAELLFTNLFFNSERYDLSAVGRVKMNSRLELDCPDNVRVLRKEDIVEIVRVLLDLKDGRGQIDDIDNLANRRVRSVGELLENQYRLGFSRMERAIRERMSSVEIDSVMPHDLINSKPVASAIREFFGTSQLSQFMDQANPLGEINHKRRLSALGPGGLTRDRATFEVRDVHPTHYGRICPIETPEGPNIGLINSLATYARVNKYGFIESPYRKVIDGKVTSEAVYMTAVEEGKYVIAQANTELDKAGKFVSEFINCRKGGDSMIAPASEVDYMDLAPKQIVSVAASLIPFVENDDANRALMGSNMQRQAVPLLRSEKPLVGTGMERAVARDSGVAIIAKRSGIVDQVDAKRIVIRATDTEGTTGSNVDIFNLVKFQRSNDKTCLNQRPLVKTDDRVMKGDIIADGPCMDMGELSLGRNVLMAFMSWNGYNFEDSIIISERIARNDVFTSIHIDEFEVAARDTKLGNEEITRDIPNVGEEALRHLDEAGIVYIGADVKPGDILVGKVTPKGESPSTPEEKLLKAIFGEKSSDVRDTSLRVPPGIAGTVVEVRVFSRRGIDKDERSLAIERSEIDRLAGDRDAERSILDRNFYASLQEKLIGQKVVSAPGSVKKGTVLTQDVLDTLSKGQWRQINVEDDSVMSDLEAIKQYHDERITALQARFEDKVEKVRRGDELQTGVLKMVKVFIATKRKLQPGDKMAGRHGNKGVVSKVVPLEDMPHLEDGTPVDIILNPLGIPSRMNVGQVLETHLGWAAHGLGKKVNDALAAIANNQSDIKTLRATLDEVYEDDEIATDIKAMDDIEVVELATNLTDGIPMASPVFDGAHEVDINHQLRKAGLDASGQVQLYDGRTGEPFDRKATVGYMYLLKLHHLVDDKIHARSVGPYSLVTQQPLGGKAQFGGQRFGEMEVWALEAYGAAYTLQEMLTVKSDDVSGRTKVYEAMVRGDDNFESGVPESFNVLVKELRSLGLNVDFGSKI